MKNSKVQILTPVNIVGFILITMAGWIDIIGLRVFFGERSAFMTGRASALGASIIEQDTAKIMVVLVAVLSFIAGAVIGTKQTKKHGLTRGLLTTAALLLLAGLLMAIDGGKGTIVTGALGITAVLIPASMGCMNASTSLTSISRTTHLTGPTTDIGMSIANEDWNMAVFWILRWLGFLVGAMLGLVFMDLALGQSHPALLAFLIPSITIALTAIIQEKTVNIPLK